MIILGMKLQMMMDVLLKDCVYIYIYTYIYENTFVLHIQ